MKNVGILLFDDIELLDFAGPYEVFAVADELNDRSLFDVFTLSENGNKIKTIHGLRVQPDYSTGNAPWIDILVIPAAMELPACDSNWKLPCFNPAHFI